MKNKLLISHVFIFSLASSNGFAAACSYSEAMTAFKQGNHYRGQVLMQMAAKDGDERALSYLAQAEAVLLSQTSLLPNQKGAKANSKNQILPN